MKVLLPLDGSHLSEAAVDAVQRLCHSGTSCSVEVLQVLDPMSALGAVHLLLEESQATEYVHEHAEVLAKRGITASSYVDVGTPARWQSARAKGAGHWRVGRCRAPGLGLKALGVVPPVPVITRDGVRHAKPDPRLSRQRQPF